MKQNERDDEKPPVYMQVRVWGCIILGCLGFWACILKLLYMERGW